MEEKLSDLSKATEQEADVDKIPAEGWFQSPHSPHCVTQPQNIPTRKREKTEDKLYIIRQCKINARVLCE